MVDIGFLKILPQFLSFDNHADVINATLILIEKIYFVGKICYMENEVNPFVRVS